MYVSASKACSEPNSTTPLTAAQLAGSRARMEAMQAGFNNSNAIYNEFILALGGNPTGAITGDAGIPTTGQPWDWSRVDRRGRPGAGDLSRSGLPATLGDTRARSISCTPPEGRPLKAAFYFTPPVMFNGPAPAAPAPAAAIVAAAPVKPASAPVCVTKTLSAAGLLPARTWQECTIDGVYSCGWNEYMESVNYDQPFASEAAKAAAQAKYQKCLAAGRGSMYGPGLSGVLDGGPGSGMFWGSLALAGFALWAVGQFDKGGR